MSLGRVTTETQIASEIGWAAVAGYLTIALLCAWLALHCSSPDKDGARRGWCLLLCSMTALGINKQLNLQTFLLEAGRVVAKWGHWYSYRRYAQVSFVFTVTLIGALVAWKILQYYWPILQQRVELAAGLVLIAVYCILRAAEIDHIKAVTMHTKFAHTPFWFVEIAGILLTFIGTIRALIAQRLARYAL